MEKVKQSAHVAETEMPLFTEKDAKKRFDSFLFPRKLIMARSPKSNENLLNFLVYGRSFR